MSYKSLILSPRFPRGVFLVGLTAMSLFYIYLRESSRSVRASERNGASVRGIKHRSVYVKMVIFTLGAVSDTVKNREQYRSVYEKRVTLTLGACQFGREDQERK